MNPILAALFGALAGAAIVWVLVARRRVKLAMFDEIERDSRFGMRRALGHIFPKFSPAVSAISPQFCTIYQQAADAESYGLDQVCGVGYGRALEFLVKDYAKRDNPDSAEQIERASLAVCIQNFMTDPAIRDSTDLARWARNEETHYIRRYAGRDIKDLKRLVALTVALIENSEQRRALERDAEQEKLAFDALQQKSND